MIPKRCSGYQRIGGRSQFPCWISFLFIFVVASLVAAALVFIAFGIRPATPSGQELLLSLTDKNSSCPKKPNSTLYGHEPYEVPVPLPSIADEDVAVAYQKASGEIGPGLFTLLPKTAEGGGCPYNFTRSPETLYKFRSVPIGESSWTADIAAMAMEGEVQERTTLIVKSAYGLRRHEAAALRSNLIGRSNRRCTEKQKALIGRRTEGCSSPQTYRTYDGTCNNPRFPLRGAANTIYVRGLPADYADGVSVPRTSSVDGSPLPPVRIVSNEIHASGSSPESNEFTALMTFWGQFVTHDLSKALSNLKSGDCCGANASASSDCIPIVIAKDDKFYSQFNVSCFPISRSQPAPQPDCLLGPREHVNVLTSYLDGSVIYGSSAEEAAKLRSFKSGQLDAFFAHGTMLLPITTNNTKSCTQDKDAPFCFYAGDSRSNENLSILSLHTIFLREHNRLSALLSELNPSWDDERLFQEARRVVVAELQRVTYAEYLPLVLGQRIADDFGLRPLDSGYYEGYSPAVDPSVTNEFAAAAQRFGHSGVPDHWQFANDRSVRRMDLHRGLFLPSEFVRDNDTLASLLYGTSVQGAALVDPYYTTQLTDHLFQTNESRYGFDLAAINLQRGRDHGIPAYNRFRQYCGLPKLDSFRRLKDVFVESAAQRLAELYRSVDDFDLHTAGLSERPLEGSQLGPVFACLIGDQFSRLRQGDRFWYENGPGSSPNPFTPQQLEQIRRVTLARIVCDTVDNVRGLPPSIFRLPSERNVPVSCAGSQILSLDIRHWKEEPLREAPMEKYWKNFGGIF